MTHPFTDAAAGEFMSEDMGACPTGTGPSQAEPASRPSGLPSHGAKKRRGRKAVLKRLEDARHGLFPMKTCPASRHVHMIVESLLNPKGGMCEALRGYEPEHMAESIASVLEGLWSARRWMRWQPNIVGDHMAGGEWVPDMAAIAAQVIEAGTAKTEGFGPQDESTVRQDAPND